MDVSPNVLRKETAAVLTQVTKAEASIRFIAETHHNLPVEELRDHQGNWVIIPLIVAKAQCLHTLALLRQSDK